MATLFKRFITISVLLIGLIFPASAQQLVVYVTTQPPYDPKIGAYDESSLDRISVRVQNLTSSTLRAKFQAKFTGTNGITIQTASDYQPANPILILPNENRELERYEMEAMLDRNHVSYSGVDPVALLASGTVPEGSYQLCVVGYNYDQPGTTMPLSSVNGGCSPMIGIQYVEAPIIVSVNGQQNCGSTINALNSAFINIQVGQPAVALNQSSGPGDLRYELQLYEVVTDRAINDLVFSSPPFHEVETTAPLFTLIPQELGMRPGVNYVFRVRAFDINSNLVFKNNGYSQICWFNLAADDNSGNNGGSAVTSAFSSVIEYPGENDTIPFQYFPVVTAIRPAVDNITNLEIHATTYQEGVPNSNLDDNFVIRNPAISSNSSSIRIASQQYNHWGWSRGVNFDPKTRIRISSSGQSNVQEVNAESRITYGMAAARFMSSAATGDSGKDYKITFLPMKAPSRILPPNRSQLLRGDNRPAVGNFGVHEKMFIEIDSNIDFLNPRRIAFKEFRYTWDFNDISEDSIRKAIFSAKNIDVHLPDNRFYHARIGWLTDPTNQTSDAYHYSQAFMFNDDETDGCLDVSRYTGMHSGDTVCIGTFKMRVRSLSKATEPYDGIGEIFVPFMNQKFVVDFTGLKIFANGYVHEGRAQMRQSDSTRALVPQNITVAQARTMLSNPANRRKLFQDSRFNYSDSGGSTLPYYTNLFGQNVAFFIWHLQFNNNSFTMFTGARVIIPGTTEPLDFVSFGTNLTASCQGFQSALNMELVSEHTIPLLGVGDLTVGQSPQGRNSVVNFNCNNGFNGGTLYGKLRVESGILVPLPSANTQYLETDIEINLSRNFEYVFTAILPGFQLAGLNDFNFQPDTLVVDKSFQANSPVMQGFTIPNNQGTNWTGVFLSDLKCALPWYLLGDTVNTGLAPPENPDPILLRLPYMFIDGGGATFAMEGSNLMPLSRGRKWGGWGYSIDSVRIAMNRGSLTIGRLKGILKTPLKTQSDVQYTIEIGLGDGGELSLSGSAVLGEGPKIEAIGVTLTDLNTSVSFGLTSNNKVAIKLIMDGNMDMMVPSTDDPAFGLNAAFTGLYLSNNKNDVFGCESITLNTMKLMGYSFGNTDDLAFITQRVNQKQQFLLRFRGGLSLGANLFTLGGGGTVGFEVANNGSFSLVGPNLDSFTASGNIGPFGIRGTLAARRNHSIYGNGFYGDINCSMDMGVSVGVGVKFMIGKTTGVKKYDYWMLGGSTKIPGGIIVVPAALKLDSIAVELGEKVKVNSNGAIIPDESTSFYVKGAMQMTSMDGAMYRIRAAITAQLNGYAINQIYLDGGLALLGSPYHSNSVKPSYEFSADIRLAMDFANVVFTADATAYLNGYNLMTGAGPNNRLGTINLKFSRNEWYLHAGKPSSKLGVRILGASFQTYFMIGHGIEPPIYPPAVVNALGDRLPVSGISRTSEQGISHGASFDFRQDDLSFLIFYGKINFTAGYHVSLMNYGNATCSNTSGKIGMNGWYAEGSVYAAVQAIIGMDVDVWCYEGKIEIANVSAGAILSMGTPNPTWMKGAIGGRYRVLNGLVKGRFNFEFSIGDHCSPVPETPESPVASIKLIEEIKPTHNTRNVSMVVSPLVVHRFNHEEVMNIEIIEPKKTYTRTFRVKREIKFAYQNQANNWILVNHETDVDYDGDFSYINLIPRGYLLANTKYRVVVRAWFEERINNRWDTARKKDNTKITERAVHEFRTTEIGVVETSTILAQWPEPDRTFVYKNTPEAVVKFNTQVTNLFAPRVTAMYNEYLQQVVRFGQGISMPVKYLMRFISLEDNTVGYTLLSVTAGATEIQYNLSKIPSGKLYKVEILRVLSSNTYYDQFLTQQWEASIRMVNERNSHNQMLREVGNQYFSRGTAYSRVIANLNADNVVETTAYQKSQDDRAASDFGGNMLEVMVNSYTDVLYSGFYGISRYNNFQSKCEALINNPGTIKLANQNGLSLIAPVQEPMSYEDLYRSDKTGEAAKTIKLYPQSDNQYMIAVKQFYQDVNALIREGLVPNEAIVNRAYYNPTTELFDIPETNEFTQYLGPLTSSGYAQGDQYSISSWVSSANVQVSVLTTNYEQSCLKKFKDEMDAIQRTIGSVMGMRYNATTLRLQQISTTYQGVTQTATVTTTERSERYPFSYSRYVPNLSKMGRVVNLELNAMEMSANNWVYWIHRVEPNRIQLFPNQDPNPGIRSRNEPLRVYEAFNVPFR